MKIAVLGDTHIGMRSNSELFHKHAELFFKDVFLPYLKSNDIHTVLQMGDLFDVRQNISTYSLARSKEYLFDPLKKADIDFHVLVGNHDIFHRESLEVNTPTLVLPDYRNITIYTKPTKVVFDSLEVDVIPWMCKENAGEIDRFIKASKSKVCAGHWAIAGFSMYRGVESKGGISPSTFDRYALTLSGHFHTKSHKDTIHYVGTPYEITWQDYNDPRGFHVLDTETLKLEFIKNPHTIFVKVEYDDLHDDGVYRGSVLTDKIVRVVVLNKTKPELFDNFLTTLHTMNPHEMKIIEDLSEFREGVADEEINLQDTLSVMSSYVDSVDTDLDKNAIKEYMKSLYLEAINQEVV